MIEIHYHEEQFLKLVKNGNCDELHEFLKDNPNLNINCKDFKGYHALDIAVLRDDEEEILQILARPDITVDHVQSAISRIIKSDKIQFLDTLLDFLDEKLVESIYEDVREVSKPSAPELVLQPPVEPSAPPANQLPRSKSRSCLFPRKNKGPTATDGRNSLALESAIKCSPMITAALCENAEVIHQLYRRGYRIDKPHHPNCECLKCCWDQRSKRETLSEAIRRLNIYSALASPTYIILTSSDPVLTAFELCEELKILARIYVEYKENYKHLQVQCSKFAGKMLDLCQDTSEVETLLSQKAGNKDPRSRKFIRLHLAMNYEQKEFVAHPNCQQVLRSLWAEGLPNWWIWSFQRRCLHVWQHVLLSPLVLFSFVFLPVPYVKKTVAVPLHRFIYATTSYISFLIMLLLSLVEDNESYKTYNAGWKDSAISVWVAAHFWEILVNIKILGFKVCFRRWWLRCDLLMYSFFVAVQGIRCYGYITRSSYVEGPQLVQLINVMEMTDSFFAFASMMAFYRLLYLYQEHAILGTLERTLQFMIKDVFRFFGLILVAIGAFAVGLNYIYRRYKKKQFSADIYQKDTTDFSSLYTSIVTLFWAMLGKGGTTILTETAESNASHYNVTLKLASQDVNDFFGHWIWALYHILTGVVLLNMLIAMLADSFNRVQSDADTEWKFCRADLWLSFFDGQSSLPPPFNVLPTIKDMPQTFAAIVKRCFKRSSKKSGTSSSCCSGSCDCCFERENSKNESKQERDHKELVAKMVQRYLQAEETLKALKIGKTTHVGIDRRQDDSTVKFRSEIYADIRNSK